MIPHCTDEPYYDPVGNRLRWLYPEIVSSSDQVYQLLEISNVSYGGSPVDKISIRLILEPSILGSFGLIATSDGYIIEAIMPINSTHTLVYLSKMGSNRKRTLDDIENEQLVLDTANKQPPAPLSNIITRFDWGIYYPDMLSLDTITDNDRQRIVQMHQTAFSSYQYNFEEKLPSMLQQAETYPMMCIRSRNDNIIQAFSNMEYQVYPLSGSRYSFFEYDNAIRDPSLPKGMGFYKLLRLLLAWFASNKGADLCYAEGRAALISINCINFRCKMKYAGTLARHINISGQRDFQDETRSPYEDLNVWYYDKPGLDNIKNDLVRTIARLKERPEITENPVLTRLLSES